MNKLIISIIAVSVIAIGISAFFLSQKPQTEPSTLPKQSPQQDVASSTNTKSLFGIMGAFTINDAAMSTPGMSDAIQKGWTEFRKDNSAYQNLKANLKKLIQNRVKFVKKTGFSVDREIPSYFTWNIIEPQRGQFDWELTDIYVNGASDASVKISAVIQPFAGWDQKNTQTNKQALDFAYYDYKAGPPNDLAEYENFLTKTVERYKNKVAVWEIANEPENPGEYQNNPEGYFDLVKITSEIIKKADPKAKVTNGGAMPIVGMRESDSFKDYWTKFFALGGNQYIDYFNVHYNIERSQDVKLDPAIFEKDLVVLNNLMDKNGGRKPLYLTEFGIYSGAPSEPAPMANGPAQESGQTQTNLPTQPTQSGPSPNQPPSGGKCGDSVCDAFETANPNACPQDCGGSVPSGSPGQSPGQPTQGQATGQNTKPNQGKVLPKLSENAQTVLYFKDSILAFANGVKVVFIDLIGPDNSIVGSSMAFNTDGQPRLFLTTLKTINQKLAGFSKVEKIVDGQYKFTVDNKTVYALWSGTLPNEISGKVKVTDINGQEQIMDATGIKLKVDQPVLIEL